MKNDQDGVWLGTRLSPNYEESFLPIRFYSSSFAVRLHAGFRSNSLEPGDLIGCTNPHFRSKTDPDFPESRSGHRLSHAGAFCGARRSVEPALQGLHRADPPSQERLGSWADEARPGS